MRHSYSFILVGLVTVFCAVVKADVQLPGNVDVPNNLVPAMQRMYSQSATFRAQCDRIAAAERVHVTVRFDLNIRHTCRAFTIVSRRGKSVCAEVHVPPGRIDFAELLGHEFEHILEQIEGLDMRSLARTRGTGVREVEFELFESDRAQHAGRMIAAELRLAGASSAP